MCTHACTCAHTRVCNIIYIKTPIVSRQEHGGCFDQLSPQIGLTFCGELSYPQEGFKALSPAYGPSKASLRIEKDEDLTVYHFKTFLQTKGMQMKVKYFIFVILTSLFTIDVYKRQIFMGMIKRC